MVATWYNGTRVIDQDELRASKGRLTEAIDGSLVIAEVERSFAGRYECRVDRQVRAVYRLVGKQDKCWRKSRAALLGNTEKKNPVFKITLYVLSLTH